jgi:hypothetical protein
MRRTPAAISSQLFQRNFSRDDIAALAADARARAVAARAAYSLKRHDSAILAATVQEFRTRYPEKANQYTMMWEKTHRDMRMNLRYCWQSAALNDPEYGRQATWWWFRTILNAFGFDPAFVEDGYRILQTEVRKRLPADEADAIASMIEEMIVTLKYDPLKAFAAKP